ncbi:hypothetical protein EGH21_22585 [Halomicroarcula sp. F13]|uniref:Uncharacterized protein n=1 Tax=Haloarcula rubra TaxID=2487747 RepID=A0AAW4PYU1_9EURY|nr:hypothetical protein [Halomicroarcula rubra]MBX0325809.1 hypothetical protein [Halomicroarcula rubra]
MKTFTIITTSGSFDVDGERWTRDDNGDVYVYADDTTDADPVAEVDAPEFTAIFDANHGTHVRD